MLSILKKAEGKWTCIVVAHAQIPYKQPQWDVRTQYKIFGHLKWYKYKNRPAPKNPIKHKKKRRSLSQRAAASRNAKKKWQKKILHQYWNIVRYLNTKALLAHLERYCERLIMWFIIMCICLYSTFWLPENRLFQ